MLPSGESKRKICFQNPLSRSSSTQRPRKWPRTLAFGRGEVDTPVHVSCRVYDPTSRGAQSLTTDNGTTHGLAGPFGTPLPGIYRTSHDYRMTAAGARPRRPGPTTRMSCPTAQDDRHPPPLPLRAHRARRQLPRLAFSGRSPASDGSPCTIVGLRDHISTSQAAAAGAIAYRMLLARGQV
jgi:hypothetical protein